MPAFVQELPAVLDRHDLVVVDVGGDRNGVRARHDGLEDVAIPDVAVVVCHSSKNAVRPTPRHYAGNRPCGA